MAGTVSHPQESTRRTSWVYVPRPSTDRGRGGAPDPRTVLSTALRLGHGSGVDLDLVFASSGEALLRLAVAETRTERWVERALLPAYEEGAWRRAPLPEPWPVSGRWTGRRLRLPRERGSPSSPAKDLGTALMLALNSVGAPARLTVSLRPAPPPRLGFLDRWLLSSDPGAAPVAVGRTASANSLRDRRPPSEPPAGPVWLARVELVLKAPAVRNGARGPPAPVVAAWRVLDEKGLAWRAAPGPGPPARPFFLLETEVEGLFPTGEGRLSDRRAEEADGGPVGLGLGRTSRGEVIRLPVEPESGRHFAIVGETGMGKSSLLVALASRAARLGGLVLLDPLGETAAVVREELRALGREARWIAPGEPAVHANALEGLGRTFASDPVQAERRLEDLVHGLRRVRAGRYVEASFWGPRLEEMLARALRTVSAVPGATLEDAHDLLAGAGEGRLIAPPAARPVLRELAARLRERPEDAEGARRLLYEVVRNPTLRSMLCSREPTLSVPDLVRPGALTVISGEAGTVGESTARYLLSVYLALVWSELLARGGAAKTFVILDEAQWFAHESLAEMLRLARRRNVHVGLATQSLGSLPDEVRAAVWTNVADLIAFRGAPEEARELARMAPALSVEALLALPRGHAAFLLGKGERVGWIRSARRPPPLPRPDRAATPRPRERAPVGEGCVGTAWVGEKAVAHVTGPAGRRPSDDPPELVTRVRRGLAPAPGTGVARISLNDLRARFGLSEVELRFLGGELGRRGLLARTERGADGTAWWIRTEPASRAGRSDTPAPPEAPSTPPQWL